jgi:hypothetical protein
VAATEREEKHKKKPEIQTITGREINIQHCPGEDWVSPESENEGT